MTDMGHIPYDRYGTHLTLPWEAEYNKSCLFLSQSLYAQEIIDRAGMRGCKPIAKPVDLKS